MSSGDKFRQPRTFDPSGADVEAPEVDEPAAQTDPEDAGPQAGADGAPAFQAPTLGELKRGFRWGALFFAASSALASLAIGVWFARLVSVALARDDWVGWLALGLLGLMGAACAVLLMREIFGLARLRAMTARRTRAEEALRQDDARSARSVVKEVRRAFRSRRDLNWALARHKEQAAGLHDARETLVLADRELLSPLDAEGRKIISQSAKRVAVVTALSPAALIDVLFVLAENLRMLRRLATLYGGRPGWTGAIAFAKRVVGHLVATGGVALTDDLLGQFLGQDLVRRLSRRMGEGLFNGALTARIGVAAIDLCRPLPFIEATPPKFREIVKEIAFRRGGGEMK